MIRCFLVVGCIALWASNVDAQCNVRQQSDSASAAAVTQQAEILSSIQSLNVRLNDLAVSGPSASSAAAGGSASSSAAGGNRAEVASIRAQIRRLENSLNSSSSSSASSSTSASSSASGSGCASGSCGLGGRLGGGVRALGGRLLPPYGGAVSRSSSRVDRNGNTRSRAFSRG